MFTVAVAENGNRVAYGLRDGTLGSFEYENESKILNKLGKATKNMVTEKIIEMNNSENDEA